MSVEKAAAGTKIKMKEGPEDQIRELVVAPACDIKDKGQWYCATHGIPFYNGFEKDSHIDRGNHVLVWLCHLHGPEVP